MVRTQRCEGVSVTRSQPSVANPTANVFLPQHNATLGTICPSRVPSRRRCTTPGQSQLPANTVQALNIDTAIYRATTDSSLTSHGWTSKGEMVDLGGAIPQVRCTPGLSMSARVPPPKSSNESLDDPRIPHGYPIGNIIDLDAYRRWLSSRPPRRRDEEFVRQRWEEVAV